MLGLACGARSGNQVVRGSSYIANCTSIVCMYHVLSKSVLTPGLDVRRGICNEAWLNVLCGVYNKPEIT